MTPAVSAPVAVAFPATITESPTPCYFCDPYGYPWRLDLRGVAVMVCEQHAEVRGVLPGRVLPPGWKPSWRRGIWA